MNEIRILPQLVREVYRYEENTEADYSTLGYISVFFGVMLYIVNFNNVDHLLVALTAYTIASGLCLMPFVLKRLENKTQYLDTFMAIIFIVETVFMLYGVNEGYSNYWAILATFVILIIFGMPRGLLVCTYFMVVSIIFFWTPVRANLPYNYSDSFCQVFPFLYILAFFISFIGNLFIKKHRIEQEIRDATLKVELREAIADIEHAMLDSVAIISTLIDEKDLYTKEHSKRVATYSRQIAERYGDSRKKEDLDMIYNIALLHDIGKIAVPDSILKKEQGLTDDEYEIMKMHTKWGEEILKGMEFVPNADVGAIYHHERYDGKGYPNGLSGEDIPLAGRIISVADTFDAMNSERVYRKPCSREYILKVLKEGRGTQFDATLADILCDLIEEGEIKVLADRQK